MNLHRLHTTQTQALPATAAEGGIVSTSWESRYTFSGKEKDVETGYSYFGVSPDICTGYDSDLSIWLSVDPLADKYPSMSAYMYTAGNPVMLVDPDGREIWITADDGTRIEYKPAMKYDGDNHQIASRVKTLNQMNETKTGGKVLNTLVNSDNTYNLISGEYKDKGRYCANDDIEGKSGGTVETGGQDNNLGVVSHELFHAYQDELGQGGASIFNEVEANVFSQAVMNDFAMRSGEIMQLGSFGASRIGGADGELYEKSVSKLVNGEKFSPEAFEIVTRLFKEHSGLNGYPHIYIKHPLRRDKQKISLIENLYPLY